MAPKKPPIPTVSGCLANPCPWRVDGCPSIQFADLWWQQLSREREWDWQVIGAAYVAGEGFVVQDGVKYCADETERKQTDGDGGERDCDEFKVGRWLLVEFNLVGGT